MYKKSFFIIILLFSFSFIYAEDYSDFSYAPEYYEDPGEFVPAKPDDFFQNKLDELLATDGEVSDVSMSLMKFYTDYDRANKYYRRKLKNTYYKKGLDAAGFLEDAFNDLPILKENLKKYHVMSMDFLIEIDGVSATFTLFYTSEPKTEVVSYWMFMDL